MEFKFLKNKKPYLINFTLSLLLLFSITSLSFGDNIYREKDNNRFFLVFFYMASCNHCKRFEPIIKEFVEKTDKRMLSFTLDNSKLPLFPKSSIPDQEEISVFFPNGRPSVPALFIADRKNQKIYPVLQGEASIQQLEKRVHLVEELATQDG